MPFPQRRYLSSLVLTTLFLTTLAFLALAQTSAPPMSKRTPEVADANGKVIGPVLSHAEGSGAAIVRLWHRPSNTDYVVYFTREYIYTEAGDILWDQPDCQGQPVIIWNHFDANNAIFKPAAIGPDRSLWVPVKNAEPLETWPQSRWAPHLEQCENLDWEEPDEPHTPVIAMIRTTVLNDHFVPPYRGW